MFVASPIYYTFDTILSFILFVSEIEDVSLECCLELVCVIDKNHGVANIVFCGVLEERFWFIQLYTWSRD